MINSHFIKDCRASSSSPSLSLSLSLSLSISLSISLLIRYHRHGSLSPTEFEVRNSLWPPHTRLTRQLHPRVVVLKKWMRRRRKIDIFSFSRSCTYSLLRFLLKSERFANEKDERKKGRKREAFMSLSTDNIRRVTCTLFSLLSCFYFARDSWSDSGCV